MGLKPIVVAALSLVALSGTCAAETATQDFGKWQVRANVDPMTDQKIVTMTLVAEDVDAIDLDPVTLILQCSKENGAAGIAWQHRFLGGEKIGEFTTKEMTLRIDKGQPFAEDWQVLDDGTTTRIPSVERLITRVREAERFVVQTTPYNELPIAAVFDVRGVKDALLAHRPECDWFIRDLLWEEYQQKLKASAQSTQ
ncbi:hypothetical protein [Rhizobium sp. IBUN]|uniref:hypothetical protein n=1 Tax=Rhizobium sp. IBUN TaxID=1042326 RepID=UPI000409C5C9|nr:hypothetical protein [Rhizobium sp. IBUN]